ncbi:uncharacterized protein LOC104873177 [Fukomys damarensis]|uniref:uncharacterized protein LOC104873177 n=1 Tax=Fukomys damarensis TaxID=885580 RepID=UPI0014551B25|nr:uncharacterized protein LOC104873177 [Fukomys damarensis]
MRPNTEPRFSSGSFPLVPRLARARKASWLQWSLGCPWSGRTSNRAAANGDPSSATKSLGCEELRALSEEQPLAVPSSFANGPSFYSAAPLRSGLCQDHSKGHIALSFLIHLVSPLCLQLPAAWPPWRRGEEHSPRPRDLTGSFNDVFRMNIDPSASVPEKSEEGGLRRRGSDWCFGGDVGVRPCEVRPSYPARSCVAAYSPHPKAQKHLNAGSQRLQDNFEPC